MSSPPSQNGSEAEAPQQSSGQAQTAVTETTECANCGRTFVGDYCPDCGQEADTTISPFDVIAGFFRELVDLERGFWPTFKGLVLRPRTTLHEYVSGARRQFSHPGRYLMAAIVLAYLSERTLVWMGIRGAYEPPDIMTEIGPSPSLEELLGTPEIGFFQLVQILYTSQTFLVIASLLLALLVSLMLFQLLRDRLGAGESLAVGAFITGQMILWATLVAWFYDSGFYFGMMLASELPWPSEPSAIQPALPIRMPFFIYLLLGSVYYLMVLFHDGNYRIAWFLKIKPEPNHLFTVGYLAVFLYLSVMQHLIISPLVGFVLQYSVFNDSMLSLIMILLIPNISIEIYWWAK